MNKNIIKIILLLSLLISCSKFISYENEEYDVYLFSDKNKSGLLRKEKKIIRDNNTFVLEKNREINFWPLYMFPDTYYLRSAYLKGEHKIDINGNIFYINGLIVFIEYNMIQYAKLNKDFSINNDIINIIIPKNSTVSFSGDYFFMVNEELTFFYKNNKYLFKPISQNGKMYMTFNDKFYLKSIFVKDSNLFDKFNKKLIFKKGTLDF